MRVLLDHCVPRPFGRELRGHAVKHTSQVGLEEVSNGELLESASKLGFEVLVTVDGHLADQQRVGELPLAVIVLRVPRNTQAALAVHVPALRSLLSGRLQRRVYVIGRGSGPGP